MNEKEYEPSGLDHAFSEVKKRLVYIKQGEGKGREARLASQLLPRLFEIEDKRLLDLAERIKDKKTNEVIEAVEEAIEGGGSSGDSGVAEKVGKRGEEEVFSISGRSGPTAADKARATRTKRFGKYWEK